MMCVIIFCLLAAILFWMMGCVEFEVEGSRPGGGPKRTWREVVQKDCQAHILNREDAMDCRRWRKLIKDG